MGDAGSLWHAADVSTYAGPFRRNVIAFLDEHATPVALPIGLAYTKAWVLPLGGVGDGLRLHIYQETHTDDAAAAVCDQCRIIGWQHHPVCNMRYHFVVPAGSGALSAADAESLAGMVERSAAAAAADAAAAAAITIPAAKPGQSAAAAIHARDLASKQAAASESGGSAAAAEEPLAATCATGNPANGVPPQPQLLQIALPTEDALESPDRAGGAQFSAPPSIYDSRAHLLHGVLHLNGFGHLLRVNGLEGGSGRVSGRRLMDLWDTLCTLLAARQVSVEDVSNKGGMELRVLFPAAFKATWYGRWGYAFGRAGFGIRPAAWKRAATATHEASLAACLRQAPPSSGTAPARIIARYQGRGVGCTGRAAGAPSGTLGGFLARMVHLLNHPEEAEPLLRGEPPDDQARPIPASRRRSMPLPADSGAAADAKGDAAQRSGAVPAQPSQPTPSRPQRPAVPAISAAALAELRALQPAEELPKRQELLQPLQALVLPKRWGRDAMHTALEAALNALQGCRGRWLAVDAVRAAVRAALPGGADPALTEFALRSAAFRTWGGVAVYSEVDRSSGQRFFLLDSVHDPDPEAVVDQPSQRVAHAAGTSAAEPAVGSSPLPPIPRLMVEPRRTGSGGGGGGGSARPSSVRKPKLPKSKDTDPMQSAAFAGNSGPPGSDAAAADTAGGGQPAASLSAEPARQPKLDARPSAHPASGIAGPAEAAKLRASHRNGGSSRGTSPIADAKPAAVQKLDEKPAAHAQPPVSPEAAALQQAALQQAAAQQHQLAKLRSSSSPQVKTEPPADVKRPAETTTAMPAQLKAGGPSAVVKGDMVKSEAVIRETQTAAKAAEAADAAAANVNAVPVPRTPASPPPLPHRRLRSRPAGAAASLTPATPATAPPHARANSSVALANGKPPAPAIDPGREGVSGGGHEFGPAAVTGSGKAKRKSSSICGKHSSSGSTVGGQHSNAPAAAKAKPAAGKGKQQKGKRKHGKSSAALPAGGVAVPLPPLPKRMRAAAKAADAANHALFAGKRTSPKAAAIPAPADADAGDPIAWGRRGSRSVRRGSLSGSPQRLALQGALADGAASAAMDADMLPPSANGTPVSSSHASAATATPGATQGISTSPVKRQEAGSMGAAEPAAGGQQRHGGGLPPKSVRKLQPPSHASRPSGRQPSAKGVVAGSKQDGGSAMPGARQSFATEAAPAAGKLAAPPPAVTAGGATGSRLRHEAALLAQDFSTAAAGALENGRLRRGAPVDYSESRKRPAPEPVAPPVPKRPRSARVSEGGAAGVPLPPKKPWQLLVPGGPWPPLPQPTPQQNGPPTPQQTALPAPQQQQPALAAPAAQPAAVAPTVRDQVLCDLKCVYDALVRSAVAPPGVPPQIRAAPADNPAAFAAAVQVLRDTKHFVKDYGGGSAVAAGGEVRLPVTLAMPAAPPAGEGARASGRRNIRARRVPPPPPELLAVAADAQAAGVTAAAQTAFRETYRMFHDLKVDRVEGVEVMAASQTAADLVGAPALVAHGSGWDTSGAWRHAGGPEDWLVACSCGTRDDDGERMAACDACAAWAHTRCAGVADHAPVPPLFLCAACYRAGSAGGGTDAVGGAEGPVIAAAQLPPVLL